MLKKFAYVSKINKNDKEIKKLFNTLMRNIKICFEEKENKVKYEQYFFNGLPSPKDIELKDIDINSLKVTVYIIIKKYYNKRNILIFKILLIILNSIFQKIILKIKIF